MISVGDEIVSLTDRKSIEGVDNKPYSANINERVLFQFEFDFASATLVIRIRRSPSSTCRIRISHVVCESWTHCLLIQHIYCLAIFSYRFFYFQYFLLFLCDTHLIDLMWPEDRILIKLFLHPLDANFYFFPQNAIKNWQPCFIYPLELLWAQVIVCGSTTLPQRNYRSASLPLQRIRYFLCVRVNFKVV